MNIDIIKNLIVFGAGIGIGLLLIDAVKTNKKADDKTETELVKEEIESDTNLEENCEVKTIKIVKNDSTIPSIICTIIEGLKRCFVTLCIARFFGIVGRIEFTSKYLSFRL